MDIERTLETQRHRLLRIVAGLVVAVGVLALGPVSHRFSDWTLSFVGSILTRAEAATRYLLIAQACLMVDRCGLDIDRSQISIPLAPALGMDDTKISVSESRRRLKALRAMLLDLPRYALRLLHRIEKQIRRAMGADRTSRDGYPSHCSVLDAWHLTVIRIERPPDKIVPASLFRSPPPVIRAGGKGG